MEKAKTASSTSHSSEIRWRGNIPTKAHHGALTRVVAHSHTHLFSDRGSGDVPRVIVKTEYGSDGCWS